MGHLDVRTTKRVRNYELRNDKYGRGAVFSVIARRPLPMKQSIINT